MTSLAESTNPNLTDASALPRYKGVIAYHEIDADTAKTWYSVTRASFFEQLRYISSVPSSIKVTFDDGTLSEFELGAAPLAEFRIQATFFVCAGLIGKPGMMEWSHLRELAAAGHCIQSHGWQHRLLTHCTAEELRQELIRSRDTIEDRIGRCVNSISMPGGRVSRNVLEQCALAGYRTVYTSEPWVDRDFDESLHVRGRMMATRTTTPETLGALASGSSRMFWGMRTKKLVRSTLTACMGDHAYQQLWRKLSGRTDPANTAMGAL